VKRRAFIGVLGGATAWPLGGHAQQSERLRRVGWLVPWPETDAVTKASMTVLVQVLERLGWVEGKNIRIDCRFASGDPALYKNYAAELVALSPDVLLAGNTPAVPPLRQQTSTIPIVFVLVSYPVELGFVQSLARPGGNITGFSAYDAPIMGKWVQLLKELAPRVTRVAVIFNPGFAPFATFFNQSIDAAAASFGITVTLAPVRDDAEIEDVIAGVAREPGGGLINLPEGFSVAHRDVISAAALRHGLPLIGLGELARAGGLVAYVFNTLDVHAQGASYIDRILRGANPADLPVQQPTKWSLIINLRTANALGLSVPPSMLDLADEVIE
jgi:putative ABC transport system substrate-binding protein